MFLRFFVCCGLLFSAVLASAQEKADEPMEIYLLVGQSNMAGRGKVEEEDRKADPRILVLDKNDQWVSQGEPIHFDKDIAGVGLAFTFAKLRAEAKPGVKIGLVPCAVGGTSMDQWQPGGKLYPNAIRRAKLAMEKGTLKAILWHQGEADSGTQEKAAIYGERLQKLIASFRQDLNLPQVPFIVGELGEFLYPRPQSPFAQVLNGQIGLIPAAVPGTAVVSSKDLKDKGDKLHFSSESLKEFGKRYDSALRGVETKVSAP